MRDPYTVLGLARSASEAEIKKAYRKLAKDNHPDRHKDDKAALERFKEANSAYALLSDKEQKARFDRGEIGPDGQPVNPFAGGGRGDPFAGARGGGSPFGRGGGSRSNADSFEFSGDASDLFSELFRGRSGGSPFGQGFEGFGRQTPAKGGDVAYRLVVPFEAAATLKPQRITLKSGKALDVKLPAGFESGRQLRLGGQGDPGPGGAGDALVTLEIGRHRVFSRDGDDIRLELPLTLDEAVQGAKVRVPTVDGAVTLTVPPGVSSGRAFRLKGKGFTRADGSRGDQLATARVDLPADDAELRAFTERWQDRRNIRGDLGV